MRKREKEGLFLFLSKGISCVIFVLQSWDLLISKTLETNIVHTIKIMMHSRGRLKCPARYICAGIYSGWMANGDLEFSPNLMIGHNSIFQSHIVSELGQQDRSNNMATPKSLSSQVLNLAMTKTCLRELSTKVL